MTNHETQPEVEGYLRQLDEALADGPMAIGLDIRGGIDEELRSLDPAGARRRVEELGDPALIAADARPDAVASAVRVPVPGHLARQSTTYVIVTSLAVAIGGAVLVVVGWVVGIVMMWFSPRWRRWEKWVATVAPFAMAAVVIIVVVVIPASTSGSSDFGTVVGGAELDDSSFSSSLLWWHFPIFLAALNAIVGVWLLVRGLKRVEGQR